MIKKINLFFALAVIPVGIFSMHSSRIVGAIVKKSVGLRYPMGGIIGTHNENADFSYSKSNSLPKIEHRAIMVVKDIEKRLTLSEMAVGIVTLDDFIKDLKEGCPIYSKLSEWQKMNLLHKLSHENLNTLDKK